MKHSYLKLALALPLLLGANLDSGAQIVLHDATDVTQTKATLSADFPDGTTDHGFQYKYGTLPEIDDFSRCALAPNSDPVQVNYGAYTYPWISNSSQQEIVSNGNLPIGEESKMSISAEFYTDTEISFEWAVDSEEEIGILYFSIDDNIIDAISGYKDYAKFATIVTAGQHTLTWAYNKKEISNFGLDIGKVRNIRIYNTIEGEWNYVNDKESVITGLLPGSNILYYATAANAQRSEIKQFNTLPVKFSDQMVHDITQTSAILDLNLSYGDAIGEVYVQLVDSCDIPSIDIAKCVLSPQTFGSNIIFNGTEKLTPGNNLLNLSGEQCENFSINFELKHPATLTFDVQSDNTSYSRYYLPRMYLDGVLANITETSYFIRYSFELEAGEHVLKFRCHYKNSIQIKNFDIDNVERKDKRIDATLSDNIIINMDELKPNSTYFVRPVFSIRDKNWAEYDSGIKFSTKEIEFNINEDYNLTQTTAKINFDVNGGNSVITKVNFNYRPSNSDRWSSSEVIETDGHYSQFLNRLKTDTSYEFRICAITDRNDSIFSPTKIFKTLPITISQLEAISLTQSKAVIKIPYQIGDAPILKSWYEFSVLNGSLIEKKEFELDQNSDSILVVFEDLRYNTSYTVNVHIEPVGAKIIDYPGLWFKTKDIAVLPPTIKKVSMHEAVITGHAITGDAKIDKKGISVGGIGIKYTTEEDSIFDISFHYCPLKMDGVKN